jgi:translation initiation factor 1
MLSTVCLCVLHQEFACNGTVVQHPEYGEVIQLTGDQRNHIYEFLLQVGFCTKDQLKLHGF